MVQGLTQYKQIIQNQKSDRCNNSTNNKLNVLSWNCKGGDKNLLDTFIGTYQPDIVILQECTSTWYNTSQPPGYSGQTISERHIWPLSDGQLVSDGVSNYCVLYKNAKFQVVQNLDLLDYRNQASIATPVYPALFTVPSNVDKAVSGGFAARLPAMMKFQGNERLTVTLFNWHAHTSQDGIQTAGFQHLVNSVQFRMAVGEAGDNDLVIIAGDFNNTLQNLGGLTGINQNLDHIFANSGVHNYEGVMNTARTALITNSGDHTAVGGLIDY